MLRYRSSDTAFSEFHWNFVEDYMHQMRLTLMLAEVKIPVK